eukprot:16846-Heterococcus_DN1.PRE.2
MSRLSRHQMLPNQDAARSLVRSTTLPMSPASATKGKISSPATSAFKPYHSPYQAPEILACANCVWHVQHSQLGAFRVSKYILQQALQTLAQSSACTKLQPNAAPTVHSELAASCKF